MATTPWPDLGGLDLDPTIGTLHLWSQVIGKLRLMLTPWENHSWHVPLYVSSRGLVTGLIAIPGLGFTIEFDLLAGELVIAASSGATERLSLTFDSVADFYAATRSAVHRLGVSVEIDTMPSEMPAAIRFEEDVSRRSFDPAVARTYWRALIEVQRVFQLFRTRFTGKVSPIHLFWGAFDLAITRFSGRAAPPHPGSAPHMDDAVMREAYSREVSSAGFWPNPGSSEGPCFYSYAYPVPAGYADHPIAAPARFEAALGEFILPYAAVVASRDPDAMLLAFLQTSYEAAAELAKWDRALLDRPQGKLGQVG